MRLMDFGWGLGLACLLPSAAWAQKDAAGLATCKVLEAAYTAAIESKVPAYPIDIRPSQRSIELKAFVPDYKARMALAPGEFEDLLAREEGYRAEAYRPICVPSIAPSTKVDEEGHRQFVSFTSPIFASGGALAVVEISFREEGRFGYGMLCVARRSGAGWGARCLPSWIV